MELLGRLIAFNIHSDYTTFISYLYHERDSLRQKVRNFIFTKEINSQHYQNALINKIVNTGIDCFKISLSPKDLLHFESIVNFMEKNASRSDAEKLNAYRKISIEHNGSDYDAKLKLHLGEPRHWKDPKKSYSLFQEDLFIKKYFRNKTKGFYIDVGCYHPLDGNNTHLLHAKGWNGINFDINFYSIELFNFSLAIVE